MFTTLVNVMHRFRESKSYSLFVITVESTAIIGLLLIIVELYRNNTVLQEERLARAWESVARAIPGNSGKVTALEYLSQELKESEYPVRGKFVVLSGIDLSCKKMGGKFEENTIHGKGCTDPVYLKDLDLSPKNSNGRRVVLDSSDFSGADLERANFIGMSFQGGDLKHSFLQRTNLVGTNFSGTELTKSNLAFSNAPSARFGDLEDVYFGQVHISCTSFGKSLNIKHFNGSWAWVDMPPIGLSEDLLKKVRFYHFDKNSPISVDPLTGLVVDPEKYKRVPLNNDFIPHESVRAKFEDLPQERNWQDKCDEISSLYQE